jgi:hypothetical protein
MRKKPDYAVEAKQASVAMAKMKLQRGALAGYFLGSGDRGAAIERLKRWVGLAEEHLSTEMIDQVAMRIMIYMNMEVLQRDAKDVQWVRRWDAEIEQERGERRRVN